MGNGQEAWAYRLRFHKSGLARFLSHRDLLRVFRRAFRRSGLRLVLSRGFNPRPRIRIRPAAALGFALRSSALEVVLGENPDPEALARSLSRTLPEGLRIENAAALPSVKPARLASVVWRLPLPPMPLPAPSLPEGLEFEAETEGTCLVTVASRDGADPPGVKRLARLLAPDDDPGPYLLGAELVRTNFEDGL
jgi:hypothetical protein